MSDTNPEDIIDGLTQRERKNAGLFYHPLHPELNAERAAVRVLMKEFNTNPDLAYEPRIELMHKMFGMISNLSF